MTTLANDRLLKALRREPVDRTPIWMMRQAGRYLPEYRKVRAKAGDFLTLCQTPDLACEVTMQPIDRFGFDAAILFSDILTIPDAMGLGLKLVESQGPVFTRTIQSKSDIEQLPIPDPEGELKYVMDAVRLIHSTLGGKVPLIGFAGSPWTLATYMLEGQGSKQFNKARGFVYQEPMLAKALLAKLTEAVTLYLAAQIRAGADVVMLFDTWGGLLSTDTYQTFSLLPMANIIKALKKEFPDTPVVIFTKGSGTWLKLLAEVGADGVGIDWQTDLAFAKSQIGDRVALQGNLDPAALYGSEQSIEAAVKGILAVYQGAPGHIFNLGHGIYPDMDPEKVKLMVDTVKASTYI